MVDKSGRMRWLEFRALRKAKRYTQEAFGQLLGMSQAAVSRHEREHSAEPVDPDKLAKGLAAPSLAPTPKVARKKEAPPTSAPVAGSFGVSGDRTWRVIFSPLRKPLAPGWALFETVPAQVEQGMELEDFPRQFIAMPGKPSADGARPETAGGEPAPSADSSAVPSSFTMHSTLAMAATLALLILPAGCFFARQTARGGETPRAKTNEGTPTATVHGGAEVAKLLRAALPIPNGPATPDQLAAPCARNEEVFNGYCYEKFTLTPEQVKQGACEKFTLYELSKGWCRAHHTGYSPVFERRKDSNAQMP